MFELYDLLANYRVDKIGCLQIYKKLHFTDNRFYALLEITYFVYVKSIIRPFFGTF